MSVKSQAKLFHCNCTIRGISHFYSVIISFKLGCLSSFCTLQICLAVLHHGNSRLSTDDESTSSKASSDWPSDESSFSNLVDTSGRTFRERVDHLLTSREKNTLEKGLIQYNVSRWDPRGAFSLPLVRYLQQDLTGQGGHYLPEQELGSEDLVTEYTVEDDSDIESSVVDLETWFTDEGPFVEEVNPMPVMNDINSRESSRRFVAEAGRGLAVRGAGHGRVAGSDIGSNIVVATAEVHSTGHEDASRGQGSGVEDDPESVSSSNNELQADDSLTRARRRSFAKPGVIIV